MADSDPGEQISETAPQVNDSGAGVQWDQYIQVWPKLFDDATSYAEEYVIPVELLPINNHVPEHINVSQKLAQIIAWSLRRESEFERHGKENIKDSPHDQSNTSKPWVCEEDHETGVLSAGTTSAQSITCVEATQKGEVEDQSKAEPEQLSSHRVSLGEDSPLRSRLLKFAHDVASKITLTPTTDEAITTSLSVINPVSFGECISCFDEHPKTNLTSLSCSHDYCRDCLREVVMNAVNTESAFPPKCCLTEIPLKTILSCLNANQRADYKDKAAEYSIPAGHRWYCPDSHCAKWIPPSKLHQERHSQQTCPHCQINICSICRGNSHDQNEDCPQDFGVEEVLEIAQYEGWRRCDNCRTMVEHNTGCRHMTCKCGYQFCYVCTARWRTCACSESDAERRRNELRARRTERDQQLQEEERQREAEDAEALAEYREIEEAIRQIEEQERLEAEQRAEEEERLLAELELQRIAEEDARREEEVRQEQELRNLLLQSCSEECSHMRKILFEVTQYQQVELSSQHSAHKDAIEEKFRLQSTLSALEQEQKTTIAHQDAQSQMDDLFQKHQKEWSRMCRELEDEEDDIFMNIQLHLRNKPNREAREQRMRRMFEKSQSERKIRLQALHSQQRMSLIERCRQEIANLHLSFQANPSPHEQEHITALHNIVNLIRFERGMFELVLHRRIAMIEEHERIMLAQIEAGQEPEGLTEEFARTIEPQLPLPSSRLEPVTRNNSWESNDDQQITGGKALAESSVNEVEDMYGPPLPKTQHPLHEAASGRLVPPPLRIQTSQHSIDAPLTPPESLRTTSVTSLISPGVVPQTSTFPTSTTTPGSFPLTPRASRDSTMMKLAPEANSVLPLPETETTVSPGSRQPSRKPPQPVYGVTGALLEAFHTTGATGSSVSVNSHVLGTNMSPSGLTAPAPHRSRALKDKDRKKSFFGFGKGKDKEVSVS